ncbi:MAG: molybdopterin-guanine dinucleotide biosynthesis protein MobB, partial [Firmicutes bacterium]|nr:molybdopterin-guanine dinucleotide biosynthesis protein MobB [Bacillota bacterium]
MPGVDIVITEGYKGESFPQIEVRRAGYGEERPAAREGQLVAVVGDKLYGGEDVPCFKIDDISGVADLILTNYLHRQQI